MTIKYTRIHLIGANSKNSGLVEDSECVLD